MRATPLDTRLKVAVAYLEQAYRGELHAKKAIGDALGQLYLAQDEARRLGRVRMVGQDPTPEGVTCDEGES